VAAITSAPGTKTVDTPSTEQAAEWLGTVGWAAKGIIYLLIGALAVQLALSGSSSEQATKQGALQELVQQPAGGVLLTILTIGLFAFALYQLVCVFIDDSDGAKRARLAASSLATAAIYVAAGVQGVMILLSTSSSSDGNQAPKTWSARLMDTGPGTVVLIAAGAGLLAFSGYQLYVAVTKHFMDHLSCPGRLFPRAAIEKIGAAGIAARGVVAALLAVFVLLAVWQHDPNQAEGLDGALRTLQQQPFGSLLLFVVAAGLVSYGIFALVSARCRRHVDG
jgi:hypothetical protein